MINHSAIWNIQPTHPFETINELRKGRHHGDGQMHLIQKFGVVGLIKVTGSVRNQVECHGMWWETKCKI